MGRWSHYDGRFAPWLADEIVPSETALMDDVVVGSGEVFQSQLWRMHCHRFLTGLSLRQCGGSGMSMMLDGTTSAAAPCYSNGCFWRQDRTGMTRSACNQNHIIALHQAAAIA